MKVLIKFASGSNPMVATLHVASGVLEYADGTISHITHEMSLNKSITAYHEPKEVKAPEVKATAPEQSPKGKVIKLKQK